MMLTFLLAFGKKVDPVNDTTVEALLVTFTSVTTEEVASNDT